MEILERKHHPWKFLKIVLPWKFQGQKRRSMEIPYNLLLITPGGISTPRFILGPTQPPLFVLFGNS